MIKRFMERLLDKASRRLGYFIVPVDIPERFERMSRDGYTLSGAISDLKVLRGFYEK